MTTNENPSAAATAPGLKSPVPGKATGRQTIARKAFGGTPYCTVPGFALDWNGGAMTRLQFLYLRRLHGLSEAQANARAVLIWGAGL